MWFATCVYCKKPILEFEPCYPVYTGGKHKEYRHPHCYEEKKEKPFGHVTEKDGELD